MTANAAREVAIPGKAIGAALFTVRINPYTVNGCRPTSVVVHPASTARNPAGAITTAARINALVVYNRPRIRCSRPHNPTSSIRPHSPSIARNDQNIYGAGG